MIQVFNDISIVKTQEWEKKFQMNYLLIKEALFLNITENFQKNKNKIILYSE